MRVGFFIVDIGCDGIDVIILGEAVFADAIIGSGAIFIANELILFLVINTNVIGGGIPHIHAAIEGVFEHAAFAATASSA